MIGISGLGNYVPETKCLVSDICKDLNTDELRKIGVESVPRETQNTAAEMATIASKRALDDAGIKPVDLDLIINTQAGLHDHLLWQVSAKIQSDLGAGNANFVDLYQGCSGFMFALILAKQILSATETNSHILINTGEKWSESIQGYRTNKIVFGEAAVAAVVDNKSTGNFILGHSLLSDGSLHDISMMSMGTSNPPRLIKNKEDYFYSVRNLEKAKKNLIPVNIERFHRVGLEAVKNSNLTFEDISSIIFPSVGFGLFEKVMATFEFPLEKTNFRYVKHTGDCGSVGEMLSYHRMINDQLIKKGDNVLILSQGAGFTWSAIVIEV
ncbi:MAG TPA: hypothetical protein GXZ43_05455 [Clostridiaceae bacterium]|nr:hypothetical protein [Clostridiaceae bacterium]